MFHSPLVAQHIRKRTWALRHPLLFESRWTGKSIYVPDNFETDFMSVPRMFWIFFPPTGQGNAPSVIHDYTYRYHTLDRKSADLIFLEALLSRQVSYLRSTILFLSVRLFGWLVYRRYKDQIHAKQDEKAGTNDEGSSSQSQGTKKPRYFKENSKGIRSSRQKEKEREK